MHDLVRGGKEGCQLGNLEHPPKWASWLRIVLGAALIVFGVIRWLRRHRSAHSPAWMRQLSNTTPGKAGALSQAKNQEKALQLLAVAMPLLAGAVLLARWHY